MLTDLDKTDLKILYELDQNFRKSHTEMGKNIGISKQAVKKRIDNLIQNGTIKKFITVINMANFGVIPNQVYVALHPSIDKRKN